MHSHRDLRTVEFREREAVEGLVVAIAPIAQDADCDGLT